jgi:predicted dehydrogenase
VLIDKPMCTSVSQGESILAAAAATGATVAVGYATRFRENVELMKELLDDRAFGCVRSFVNRFGTSGGWSPKSGYILDKKTSGGGVLVVSGTHFLDRMLFWLGYPDECDLESDSESGQEANCRANFRYRLDERVINGSAIYSKTTMLPAGTVFDTEQGYLILGEMDSSEVIFRPHNRPRAEHVIRRRGAPVFTPGIGSFELQMDDFVDACLDGRSPRVDGHQGQRSMQLLQELYSASTLLDTRWYEQIEGQA